MAGEFQLKALLTANPAGLIKALGDVTKMSKTTRKYISDVAKASSGLLGKAGLSTGVVSGFLGGFSIMKIKDAMVGLTDMEDQVSKISAQTGMAAGEIKRMQFVAKLSNVPFESLVASTGKLNKNIADAGSGKNQSLAALFAKLNIPLKDANGQFRTATEMLPELADAFKRNENQGIRSQMGMALYGKSWQEMIPLLSEGSEKLAEHTAAFKRLGLEVGDETAYRKKLDMIGKFGDKLDHLSFVGKGLQNTIAADLIPVVEPMLDDLIKWAVINKDLISKEVKSGLKDFVGWIKSVDWAGFRQGAADSVASVKSFIDFVGGGRNALILLVLVMNAQTIVALAGLGAALGRAGLAFGGFALQALAPVAPLQLLQAEMIAANMKGAAIVGTFGKLSAAVGVLGAAWAGWEMGKLLLEKVINPSVQALSGDKDASLGSWIYDKLHPAESRPSLIGGRDRVGGEIKLSFDNAPAGLRVEAIKPKANTDISTDVGMRSFATGMPY